MSKLSEVIHYESINEKGYSYDCHFTDYGYIDYKSIIDKLNKIGLYVIRISPKFMNIIFTDNLEEQIEQLTKLEQMFGKDRVFPYNDISLENLRDLCGCKITLLDENEYEKFLSFMKNKERTLKIKNILK